MRAPKETGSAYQEDNNKIAQNTLTNGKKFTGKQQRSHHHHQQLRKKQRQILLRKKKHGPTLPYFSWITRF
jgi:hypothetical protein